MSKVTFFLEDGTSKVIGGTFTLEHIGVVKKRIQERTNLKVIGHTWILPRTIAQVEREMFTVRPIEI